MGWWEFNESVDVLWLRLVFLFFSARMERGGGVEGSHMGFSSLRPLERDRFALEQDIWGEVVCVVEWGYKRG